jgi:hypothetical protein
MHGERQLDEHSSQKNRKEQVEGGQAVVLQVI